MRRTKYSLLLLFGPVTLAGQTPVQITTTSPLPAGEVSVAYELQIHFSGGTPPPGGFRPSYTFTSNFSVPGLVLPNGSSDFSAAIGGTATAAGTYSFTLNVSDGQGGTASKTFQLTIHPRLEINTQTLPDATEGVDYTFQISYGGGLTPYQLFTCTSGIPGFTCSQQGLVAGKTPSITGVTQTYQGGIQLRIRSGRGFMASRNFTLTVKSGVRITIVALGTGPVGTAYSAQLTAIGGEGPYTWSATGLPPGLAVTGNALTGTPTTPGTYQVVITATAANGLSATVTRPLTISAAPFSINQSSLPTANINQPYSQQLTTTNAQGAVTWAGQGFPQGITVSPAGLVSGTPRQAGTFNAGVTATDAAGRIATRSFVFVVAAAETAPLQLVPPGGNLVAGDVGKIYAQALLATGGTAPYTFTFTGLPGGLRGDPTGTIAGNPTLAGAFPITATVTDAEGRTATGAYSLFISPSFTFVINEPSLPSATINQSYSQQLTTSNGQGNVTWTGQGFPTGITLSSGGTVSGIATQTGTFNPTVTARDANGRVATRTYVFVVAAAPGTPLQLVGAGGILPDGQVGVPYSRTVTATGGNPPYTYSFAGLPAGLSGGASGAITGTPAASSVGTSTVTVTVRDADGRTATGTYSLTIVVSGTPPAQDPDVTCDVKEPPVVPRLREEARTERFRDLVIQCTGGVPTPAGQPLPKVNIAPEFAPMVQITTPTVSLQGLTDALVDALLLVDEPSPQKQTLCGSPHYPGISGVCDHFGAPSGNGIGAYDPDLGPGRGNAYLGRFIGRNSIVWLGVPFDPPGTSSVRTIRITNVRVNAAQLNVPPGRQQALLANVQISTSSGIPIRVTNPTQTVAFVQQSMTFSVTQSGMLAQCAGDNARSTSASLRYSELFPGAFKRRNLAVTPLDPDAPPPAQHAILGAEHNTESGYVSNFSQDRFPVRIGAANSGTRLKASFHNVPAGTTVLVSVNALRGSTASARLLGRTASSAVDGVPVAEIPVSSGSATAVWEVVGSEPASLAVLNFGAYARYPPNPALGTSSVRGAFDDLVNFAGVDSQGRPTTRFVPTFIPIQYTGDEAQGAPAAFTVTDCAKSGQVLPQPAVTTGALPVNYRLLGNRPNFFSFYLLSQGDPISGVEAGAPNVSWFTVEKNTSTTPVTFKISVNPEGLAAGSYTGSFRVSGTGFPAFNFTIPLNVLPPGPHFTRWGVANAASYVPNLVSPGGALTLFGERFGPPNLVTAALTPEGKLRSTSIGGARGLFGGAAAAPEATLGTNIGDTRVLFDGAAAPMIYATAGQVSVLAPFGLAGKTFTNIEIEYRGVKSPPVAVPVAPAVPALLTADASGFGKAAALNEDNSLNSVTGALPGQYVVFFGVGGPNTDPGGRDGEINTGPLGRFTVPIKVLLDGIEVPAADIAYAGPAPSLVHGVWQANVRMPADAARNREKQIRFVFGDAATQAGVTVSVR